MKTIFRGTKIVGFIVGVAMYSHGIGIRPGRLITSNSLNPNPQAVVIPWGTWFLCANPIVAQLYPTECSTGPAQAITYEVSIADTKQGESAYHWQIIGVVGGSQIEKQGMVKFSPNKDGYTTFSPVDFGGRIDSWHLNVYPIIIDKEER